jgi:hypothetical protein
MYINKMTIGNSLAAKKMLVIILLFLIALTVSGCAQMIADSIYSDQYLKPISKSRPISAISQKAAVNAAVSAAGKTDWIPKTISVETGYVLAEQVGDAKYTRGARDYTFRLEVRLPSNGKGEVNVVITPPQGLTSSMTMDQIATQFLDALDTELEAKTK